MQEIADNILSTLKARMGAAWGELSGPDAMLLETVAMDAADLQVDALATNPADAEAVAALAREVNQTDAQLANLAAAAGGTIRKNFWGAVRDVGQVAIRVGLAAAIA